MTVLVRMSQVQLTFTPPESKRLIAKGVASLDEVQEAYKNHTVIIALGTTTGRVAEELLDEEINRDGFAAGIILPKGNCIVPREDRTSRIIIQKGKVVDVKAKEVLKDLSSKDAIIKGANAIDSKGTAGVLLGSPTGGTLTSVVAPAISRGTKVIIPVGLEKLVPGKIEELCNVTGINQPQSSIGVPVGLGVLHGETITEVEAIQTLAKVKATPLAKGGVSGGEGSTVLVVEGPDEEIEKIKKIADEVKGEESLSFETDCEVCDRETCPYAGEKSPLKRII